MSDDIDFFALANIDLDNELTLRAPYSSLELSTEEASRPEGLSPAGIHLATAFSKPTASSVGPRSRGEPSAHRRKGNGSPNDLRSPGIMGIGIMKNFSGVQKKLTRDGQPAKRRGPKPDSRPAQTRRQELNRQAQRTHRERKEQYIKQLETELARLREVHISDVNGMNTTLDQHKMALKEQQEENAMLKEILGTRGISYRQEIEARKGSKPRKSSFGSASAMSQVPGLYGTVSSKSSSTAGYSPQPNIPERPYVTGRMGSGSGGSGGGSVQHGYSSAEQASSHHSYSPADPGVFEQTIKQESPMVPDMPGVFEQDPQLQVEFILELEKTCRDHSEYLIRRSMTSSDDEDEAQYSGHALMASCPPPTHIENTPAQGGGLVPTYPHQVPQIPIEQLNNMLNLSYQFKAEGLVPGGQVTPIMALQSLRTHDRYTSLTRNDVLGMIEAVKNKVRCYGFGAVMEDFELRDALSSIFATKLETYQQAFGMEEMSGADDPYD